MVNAPEGLSSSFEEELVSDRPLGFVLSPKKADALLMLPFR